MKITQEQYEKIAHCFPKQRGNVAVDNLDFVNALLYIVQRGYKWRRLPKEYGKWHTLYTRFNRWSENGVIARLFTALQEEGIIEVKAEIVCSAGKMISPPKYIWLPARLVPPKK